MAKISEFKKNAKSLTKLNVNASDKIAQEKKNKIVNKKTTPLRTVKQIKSKAATVNSRPAESRPWKSDKELTANKINSNKGQLDSAKVAKVPINGNNASNEIPINNDNKINFSPSQIPQMEAVNKSQKPESFAGIHKEEVISAGQTTESVKEKIADFENYKEIEFIRAKAPRFFAVTQSIVKHLIDEAHHEFPLKSKNKFLDQVIQSKYLKIKEKFKNQSDQSMIKKIANSIVRVSHWD